MTNCDIIVIGLGGIGSAAACHLARRGLSVLGLEQYQLGHERGSSHGHTRIIRTAYYEHPAYIPFVRRSFELWEELEDRQRRKLLERCDCLSIGLADGALIQGVSRAAELLPAGAVECLSHSEIESQLPFRVPSEFVGRCEREAGYLLVGDCVQAHLAEARRHGAVLRDQEPILEWSAAAGSVEVKTDKAIYQAAKLVVTAGAWATRLLKSINIPLTVMRQTMHWFEPSEPERFETDRFPIFMMETPQGDFYGLPGVGGHGVKIARHYGAAELTSPDDVDWQIAATDVAPVETFLNAYLPGCFRRHLTGQVCMYTLTPDRHFIIDRHPLYPNVCVAAGFSGHGFKFAPAVGEMLAELALDGRTPEFLFSVTRRR